MRDYHPIAFSSIFSDYCTVKFQKPVLLFTTPRSGSTPMYQILERFLSLNNGVYGVEEPLNPFYARYTEENERVVWTRSANEISRTDYERIYTERLTLIKKHYGRLFFKVFPSAFRPEAFEWLTEKHEFITHERKNLFEQALSNLLSDSAKHWYSENGIKPENHSLIASRDAFVNFEKSYFHFLQLKKLLKPKAKFYYEDFLVKSPHELLKEAGFDGLFHQENFTLTKKQSPDDKLLVFKNGKDILSWYRDSMLQTICPH